MNQLIKLNSDFFMIQNGETVIIPEVAETIAYFKRQADEIKKQEDALKARLVEQMEKFGVIKIDNGELLINYIAATDRESLDGKALKAECPEVYDSYCKISKVKPSVRIKVK